MKTLLLNDTSHYHAGCVQVINYLKSFYSVTTALRQNTDLTKVDLKHYDRVILNGEGTMHHSARRGILFLDALRTAQGYGVKTYIVNTVWQDMPNTHDDVLQKCEIIEAREILSKNELIKKHKVNATHSIDCSYYVSVPEVKYGRVEVYEGQYFKNNIKFQQPKGRFKRIDIFKQPWDEIVNRLRNSELLITGRHHEMYAACVAKCRFIAYPGNTWKNEGLLQSAGVNIPHNIDEILAGKYDAEYEKLWSYMDKFKINKL